METTNLNRWVGGLAAVSVTAAILMGIRLTDREDAVKAGYIAPPAQDALVQSVDLAHIDGFRYINDHLLDVADEHGKHFKMELTEDCPDLAKARDFSLVTDGYRDMDRFTGIAVNGHVCTFRDFAEKPGP